MLKIRKNIVYDENEVPIAVQIPIKDFNMIEEILENYGLAKLMEEAKEERLLSLTEAKEYYNNILIKNRT